MAQTHKRHRLHTIARIFAGAIVTTFVILFIASMSAEVDDDPIFDEDEII